mgnify:CR=1 FL=1
MFENLSDRLSGVFDRLTKQGALSADDVKTALREVRVALLEADVALPVVAVGEHPYFKKSGTSRSSSSNSSTSVPRTR